MPAHVFARSTREHAHQELDVCSARHFCGRFDSTIDIDELAAHVSQFTAAAALSTLGGVDGRMAERTVEFFDEQPSAPIRHVEALRCGRDGAGSGDRLEQGDLSGPDRDRFAGRDPQAKPRRWTARQHGALGDVAAGLGRHLDKTRQAGRNRTGQITTTRFGLPRRPFSPLYSCQKSRRNLRKFHRLS